MKTKAVQCCTKGGIPRFQAGILLFYLKGEIQKLSRAHLINESHQSAFDTICNKLAEVIQLADHASDEMDAIRINGSIRMVYEDLMAVSEALGECGGPVRYIADTLGKMIL